MRRLKTSFLGQIDCRTARFRFVALATSCVVFFSIGLKAWANQNNAWRLNGGLYCAPQASNFDAEAWELAMKGDEYYKPLQFLVDLPAVENPSFVEAQQVSLPDETNVIGITIDGQAYAFVVDAMKKVDRHIVNAFINDTPISVTYCDLVNCVRVLSTDAEAPIPLRVGGLDVNQQLVFLLGEKRYGQESSGLPLNDFPFERTSLEQWKRQHPATKVYVGEPGS